MEGEAKIESKVEQASSKSAATSVLNTTEESTLTTLKQNNEDTSMYLNRIPDDTTMFNVEEEASTAVVMGKSMKPKKNAEAPKNILPQKRKSDQMESNDKTQKIVKMKESSSKTNSELKKSLKDETLPGPTKIEDSLSFVKICVAAPLVNNHRLAIIGQNSSLGGWKEPKGNFEQLLQINQDIYIFQGTLSVHSDLKSSFKFVHFNKANNNIIYEGDGKGDNRTDELFIGSMNFFIFKPQPKSFFEKLKDQLSILQTSETKKKIAVEFFAILFDHVILNAVPDWNAAYKFVSDGLNKIKRAVGNLDGFLQFTSQQCQHLELELNFDKLLLLIVAASKIDIQYSENMRNIIQKNTKSFCHYLHNLKSLKHHSYGFATVLENLAQHAGPEFWWILFWNDRPEEKLQVFDKRKVSESTLKTLQEMPEVLLSNDGVASRVVEYLVRWNNIDELYCNLRPIFAVNATYQQLLDTILPKKLVMHKTSISDIAKILSSDYLKKAYNDSQPTNLFSKEPLYTNGDLFNNSIKIIFDRKLSDVVRLATQVPAYLLPIVKPVVENIVTVKINPTLNFSKEDYRYFSQLNGDQLDDYPQTKKLIEEKLMKMTREHVKSGSFQSIPSLRLTLLVLTERMDVPLLDRPEVVDLQKIIHNLPQKFFQNLHSVIKLPGDSVENTLRAYREGTTKETVKRLENHFYQLDEILEKLQSRCIPLNQLTSLEVCLLFFCLFYLIIIFERFYLFNLFSGPTGSRLSEEYRLHRQPTSRVFS